MGWGKFNTEPTEYSKEILDKWALPKFDVCAENDKNSVWDGPRDEKGNPLPWPLTVKKEPVDYKDYQQSWSGIDLGSEDKTTTVVYSKDLKIEKIYNNTPPTHDPYANPNAHIYYQCNCGAILDPQTKSFAQLNNHASAKGWKIRFTDNGYVPYCVKCGESVE